MKATDRTGARRATPRRFAAFLVLLALGVRAPGARAQDPGPLDGTVQAPRSTYILDLPFLHFESMTGATPAPGEVLVRLASAYSNTFSHTWHPYAIHVEYGRLGRPFLRDEAEELHVRYPTSTLFFIDAEVLRTSATVEIGLGRETAVAVEVPYLDFSTVSLDNGVLEFHRAFGLSQAERNYYPTAQFVLMLQDPNGPLRFDNVTPASGIGDVSVTGKWRHGLSGATFLSADVALKLPTGSADDFRGSGSFDGGVLLGMTTTAGRQSYTLQAGYVFPGRWKGPLKYDGAPFGRLLAGTRRVLGRRRLWDAALSVSVEGSPLNREDLRAVSEPAVEVVLGLSRTLGRWGRVDLAVNEHIPRFGDGTDVGVRLGLAVAPLSWR